jgi:hypothetical protein
MENKGRSLMKWSENYPAGQLQCGDKLGMLPLTINVGQIKVTDKAGD